MSARMKPAYVIQDAETDARQAWLRRLRHQPIRPALPCWRRVLAYLKQKSMKS